MPGARNFGLMLIIFTFVVIAAVIDLRLNYENPETGGKLDWGAATYNVFALLVFESPIPFPTSWITRLAFFAIPICGLLLLGQGIIRVGSTLFNKNLWDQAMASTYKDHTIVCGLGKVGYKVTRWILDLKEEVVVIEQHQDNPFLAEVRSWGVPVIIADARRTEILESVNIKEAESIVPCTSDDLTNLSIALEARRMMPNLKVVLRMFDVHVAENVRDGFDIHTVFSIADISAPAFAAAATRAPLDHAFAFGEGDDRSILTITTFTLVPESILVGYTVGDLEDEFEVAVMAQHRGGEFMLHPHDDVVLSAGDRFVASASIEALNRLASLTPPTREHRNYLRGRWPIKTKTPSMAN
ncbi:MAG TPA: NAD-binding protein [Anaerolineae bacterium]|nr:potassium channel protein [Anaerolineae bacterium]MCB9103996.1 potassium channel protein [Anaerolineales bacterium]HRV91341.1 NAD-binding protein [Anaerolineae bacterium]